ncbi:hypothetical protein Kpol_1015p1 [Vanderwaltozyma polyspora DSM 70294]|uniref:Probable cysteine protease ATG4 n=1 Tax=Vanderwaltozyma polyspora (strain ATCC 22028 / DSM 70294 / BCRC 21397 / CBS 2163 / NBRC 10782 / NRRL Y-8283 / UCD 57-17) TaxID=436907 RepID=ATG4_VANPO|nr:uncharacterized protein Kpol_1015p1 [Vanderwaltozyma polyspora DSM 70294]A7TQN1.1 RecName: Full=Probable cysteine protease ATG4; AltName: Full=Autophagy-related protein 4 [Vanderwaltozyma polyspora DSM 70294]EDO15412.1 hypothetical protein Kpol_1015p1 [Vanderwaltozyma polyspora DSM 70294]
MELSQKEIGLDRSKDDNGLSSNDYVVLGIHYPIDSDDDKVVELANKRSNSAGGSIGMFQQFFNKVEEFDYHPGFLSDVISRIHFTYRTKFIPIARSDDGPSPLRINFLIGDNPFNAIENAIYNPNCFNTDIGWGCMIRTGQSLLANAIQIAILGREFRVNDGDVNEQERKIISWFMDTPDEPFSLHNFVKKGCELSSKKPGEWFGPAATSRSIQSLVEQFPDCGIDRCIVSVSSADIFKDEINDIFKNKRYSNILLLMGVKLGVDKVNEYYLKDIRKILESRYSVGISGGRPSSSLYFFGYQDDTLLYFDPHKPQPSTIESLLETCHTDNFDKINISDMDPSMLIGVLLQGEDDWQSWSNEVFDSKIINILNSRNDVTIAEDSMSLEETLEPPDNEYVDLGPMSQQLNGSP